MDIEIPSQVKTFANLAAFPITGSVKTIYIAGNTNIAYYWTGSAYAPISIQDLSGLFPNPTGTTSQYIRGDGSLETFPTIPDVTGLQSKPVVVSSNTTAQNDTVYHVVANATFTDPTPVNGRGYIVVVLAGTANLSGSSFNIPGSIIYRVRLSTSWVNHRLPTEAVLLNFFVPQYRTINGLDLTANRTLTTANINDSTNRRYVTDAQLTVIGNTSGTNTGDQDLSGLVPNTRTINGYDLTTNRALTAADVGAPSGSGTSTGTNTGDETSISILSKLGWFFYNRVSESTAVTGTTAETIIENITINANTFASGGIIRSYNNKFRKVGTGGTWAIRLYIGPNSNNLTGATLIATFSGISASILYVDVLRTYTATTSGILGFSAIQSSAIDTGTSSSSRLSSSVDWTVDQYFMITVQLGSGSDSVSLIGASLKNF